MSMYVPSRLVCVLLSHYVVIITITFCPLIAPYHVPRVRIFAPIHVPVPVPVPNTMTITMATPFIPI